MAAPSNLWDSQRGRQILRNTRARRMSRSFARVGVDIPAARLREIAAGAAAAPAEVADMQFAVMAAETRREERHARMARAKRRGIQCLIVAALVLTALNLLASTVYILLSVMLHESPF